MARKSTNKKSSGPVGGSGRNSALPGWVAATTTDSGWGRWILLTLLIWVLLAVLYPGPMFHPQVFQSSDSSNADGFERAGDAVLADGVYPLWNPYLFAGMPSFGSLSYVKYLYPPTAVFNFLQNQMGFVPLTWMLGHMLFGGLGMAWLLSRWKLPLGYLLFGALIWLLFPKVVAWGVHGHGSKLMAAMYLPWIVGWALQVGDGIGRRAIGMTGLLLGFQLLIGHPQITYYTLLVTGWLGLWNMIRPFEAGLRTVALSVRARRFGGLILGLGLGFLIAGVMLMPVHDYSGISIRGQDTAGGGGVGLDYATGWSLAPAETGTFVLPTAAGYGKATYMGHMPFTDYPNYFGFLLILLALAGWTRGSRSLVAALGVMAALAVMVSFGNLGFGLYEWIYGWLPFFNKFRIPSMILITVAFALAIVVPRSAAAWRDGVARAYPPVVVPVVLGLAGLVLLLGGGASLFKGSYESHLTSLAAAAGRQAPEVLLSKAWLLHKADMIRIGLILLTAASAFWFSLSNERFRRNGLVWVLVILVGVDLMAVNRSIIHPDRTLHQVARDSSGRGRLVSAAPMGSPYVRIKEAKPGPAAEALKAAAGHDRVWPLGPLGGQNTWMTDGVRSLGGYHPAKLAAYEPIRSRLFSEEPAGHIASWLGARVVAFGMAFGEPEFQALSDLGCDLDKTPLKSGDPWLYLNRSVLPRARLLTSWQLTDALPEQDALEPFLDGIQAGIIDVRHTVYLDKPPSVAPVAAAAALPAPVFVVDSMNEVILETESPVPALLLLSDMMANGWEVQVDGRDEDILKADLVLRAVALESGKHTVRFHYRDRSVRAGLTLSISGLVLLALLLVPVGRFRAGAKTGDRTADE